MLKEFSGYAVYSLSWNVTDIANGKLKYFGKPLPSIEKVKELINEDR